MKYRWQLLILSLLFMGLGSFSPALKAQVEMLPERKSEWEKMQMRRSGEEIPEEEDVYTEESVDEMRENMRSRRRGKRQRKGVGEERASELDDAEGPELEPDIDVQADRLEYDSDRNTMVGIGNVYVTHGQDRLSGDYITVNTATKQATARGNVLLDRSGHVFTADEMSYNFGTRQGDFGPLVLYADPFFILAEESEKLDETTYYVEDAILTTCEGEKPEMYMKASKADVVQETEVIARNVTWWWGPVPFFYLPYYRHDLQRKTNIDLVPGYSSAMGAFLLTAYNYRLNEAVEAATIVDYRSERGWGFGQDFRWEGTNWHGQAWTYYTKDENPLNKRDDDEIELLEPLVDEERYRARLSHVHSYSERDYVFAEFNYLSDPAIIEDFFKEEFRLIPQPENRITYIHRGDNFSAGATLNKRLNDFYGNIDRLPEVFFDVPRLKLGASPFYYESENSGAYFEKLTPAQDNDEDFSVTRLDSSHTFFLPTRHFNWLNIIPRAGYRATSYSDTYRLNTTTNSVQQFDSDGNAVLDTSGNPVFEDEVQKDLVNTGNDLRNIYELGFETSFKAFGIINENENHLGTGLRHIIEPYTDYTYVPEPNVLPNQLIEYDEIDTLDRRNDLKLGIRNKLQTKRDIDFLKRARFRQRTGQELGRDGLGVQSGRPGDKWRDSVNALDEFYGDTASYVHDFMDLNIFTFYRFEPEKELAGPDNDFSDLFADAEFRLADWSFLDFEAAYNWYSNEFNNANAQIAFIAEDRSYVASEYRYKKDTRDEVVFEVNLLPNSRWSATGYWFYDIEFSELLKHAYFVSHQSDCVGVGVGYEQDFRETEDDYRIWLEVWLRALPGSGVKMSR